FTRTARDCHSRVTSRPCAPRRLDGTASALHAGAPPPHPCRVRGGPRRRGRARRRCGRACDVGGPPALRRRDRGRTARPPPPVPPVPPSPPGAEAPTSPAAASAGAPAPAPAAPAVEASETRPSAPADPPWYERIKLRGYTQLRYNRLPSGVRNDELINEQGDRS